jgi:hypothetical protein
MAVTEDAEEMAVTVELAVPVETVAEAAVPLRSWPWAA